MLASNAPSKIVLPWANSGTKNTIPVASQISITPGAASFTDGFPPLTFTAASAGGVPPFGADFNGILNALSAIQRWQSGGGMFQYDATWSSDNSGYPKGALLLKGDASGFWLNTADGNTTDPDTGGAGWITVATTAMLGGTSQTMQNMTSSRAMSTVYTNNEPNPILVAVDAALNTAGTSLYGILNGYTSVPITGSEMQSSGGTSSLIFEVPAGWTYEVYPAAGSASSFNWAERR